MTKTTWPRRMLTIMTLGAAVGCIEFLGESTGPAAAELDVSVAVGSESFADNRTLNVTASVQTNRTTDLYGRALRDANLVFKFTTDRGSFVGAKNANEIEVPADSMRGGIVYATAKLKTGLRPGAVAIEVTAGRLWKRMPVLTLKEAEADTVWLSADRVRIMRDGSVGTVLTAFMRSDTTGGGGTGAVSIGRKVSFHAYHVGTADTDSVGRFVPGLAATSDSNGVAVIRFMADDDRVIADSAIVLVAEVDGAQATIRVRAH